MKVEVVVFVHPTVEDAQGLWAGREQDGEAADVRAQQCCAGDGEVREVGGGGEVVRKGCTTAVVAGDGVSGELLQAAAVGLECFAQCSALAVVPAPGALGDAVFDAEIDEAGKRPEDLHQPVVRRGGGVGVEGADEVMDREFELSLPTAVAFGPDVSRQVSRLGWWNAVDVGAGEGAQGKRAGHGFQAGGHPWERRRSRFHSILSAPTSMS